MSALLLQLFYSVRSERLLMEQLGIANHSNRDGKPWTESEEGRPLIKENTLQPNTFPTQSETNVSQGLEGVRKAAREHKEMKSPPCSTT